MNVWNERIKEMIVADWLGPSRNKYLASVLRQVEKYPNNYPTLCQLTLLKRFWDSHKKRLQKEILGV